MNFSELGFGYYKAPYRYVAHFRNGAWDEGGLSEDENLVLNESACIFQYSQACFEGLKAYRTEKGDIVCFRPDLNAARMASSSRRMMMPVFPEDRFVEAVKMVVAANKELVPPYETGASLYIRPFMVGTDPVLAIIPSAEYEFRIFVSPVGPYFKKGIKPLSLRVTDFDRAAPHGTGNIKAGLNYAMSLYATTDAHQKGFDENVYLDPASRSYIEETGGANILFITKDGKVVTPKSDSILPSITRRSLLYVAEKYLGLEVEERKVALAEIGDFAECGLCGTAAVLSPVGRIVEGDKETVFGNGEPGEITMKLYHTLRDIQQCRIPAPENWICRIDD